jgi:AAA domain
LYQVRWQEEEADHPDLEADSLLELCNRYLLKTDLRSHYRSQSLPLIDFSNKHFYQGRLSLLPDRNEVNKTEASIEYIKLEGTWENNTNRVEAEKIAEVVRQLVNAHPEKSLGIVTFNAPQHDLILDVLEENSLSSETGSSGNIFVKSIENVQGDERDIIIFSIGYAPDKKGKLTAHFGSLNQAGGENRLNVAITRAREKIIVITSILPEELHVEDSVNSGPKLLKAYLSYALEVSSGKFKPFVPEARHHSPYRLKHRIREWSEKKFTGITVHENDLPTADLTVHAGHQALGIIITDDEHYHQSISAKERHGSLPALLEQKKWKYLSCYSRRYWQDPDKFYNEVAKFITQ